MIIKRILVPTDGSDAATLGVRYAARLAQKTGATLVGLHVVDIKLLEGPFLRDLSAALGTAPYVNYQGNIALILEERGKAALESLRRTCEELSVPCECHQLTGIVHRVIIEQSSLCDLIVMGRSGEHTPWLEGLIGSTTDAVVRRATLPVLVVGCEHPGFTRFLVAYDGSPNARQSLKTAAVIGTAWKMPFHVLSVGTDADARLEEAQHYLAGREVSAEFIKRDGDPAETIIAYAKEIEADWIVMGAFGHTRLRELLVGSVTLYVLNHAPCPVLLCR